MDPLLNTSNGFVINLERLERMTLEEVIRESEEREASDLQSECT